jgi:LAO/AO transport system kinase
MALNAALQALLDGFRAGRTTALARAISLVEDEREGFQDFLHEVLRAGPRTARVGFTGPPGAGKSSIVATLATAYRTRGEDVGVVAVDPTSPFSGGALLGDRIRMNELATDAGIFIRSMATRGSLGGLATTTKEVMDLMDAFGFARVLVESVGVGQTELEITAAADTVVVVLVPESGDAIQAMKAGLMEIADLFVVNKADRPGAQRLARDIELMLHLREGPSSRRRPAALAAGHHGPARSGSAAPAVPVATDSGSPGAPAAWAIPVLETVASEGKGIDALVAALDAHRAWAEASGALARKRRERLDRRVREAVARSLAIEVWRRRGGDAILQEVLPALETGELTPYQAAARIVRALLG